MDNLIKPLSNDDIHLAAHLFNPERLILAREFRGFTKAELALRIGKTASAISQFESGYFKPDPKTLASFALALGMPLGFFALKSTIGPLMIDNCHFRSLRSASQRERRRLLSTAKLLYDLLVFINEFIDLPQQQVPRISSAINNIDDIEECAVSVRKSWGLGLGPIPNLIGLLESKGVIVSFVPDSCREVDAFSFWYEQNPLIFLINEKNNSSRARFDAAHELGHLVMHIDAAPGNPELERQAHRFAGAFLLPKKSFMIECPRRLNWQHFYELKNRWKVSVAALLKRAFDLQYISESSYRRAFVQLNKRRERIVEPHEPPMEMPTLLTHSIKLIADKWPIEAIALQLGLRTSDLKTLINV